MLECMIMVYDYQLFQATNDRNESQWKVPLDAPGISSNNTLVINSDWTYPAWAINKNQDQEVNYMQSIWLKTFMLMVESHSHTYNGYLWNLFIIISI